MKKVLTSFSVLTILAAGCNKDDNDISKPRKELIVGTWTLSQLGPDANNNGSLDAGETQAASNYNASGYYTFNSDGSGSSSVNLGSGTINSSYNWALINGDQTLQLSSGTQSISFPLKEVTVNRLVLLNTDNSPGTWNVYVK